MKKQSEIPVALRICQRCAFWENGFCDNTVSPHANKQTGAGWTCERWKPNKETRKGMGS